MTLLDLTSPTASAEAAPATSRGRLVGALAAALLLTAGLAVLSLFVGAAELSGQILVVSRIPRTAAVLLAGAAMAMSGLLMQLLVRNRFVEPATVGTTEAAGAGLLIATVLTPSMPVAGKMVIAVGTALLGTALFLQVLKRIPPAEGTVLVPLVGIMLSGVISAATTFVAYRLDLLQTLTTWLTGDFSGVLRGRFELLWLAGAALVVTWFYADRFTAAGLGRDHATNLGLNHRAVVRLGLVLVSVCSAVCVVVVGALPFLGLVVPNVVSLLLGDNLRRSLPVVALAGASLVLACDLLARTLNHPYEIPVGVIVGIVGAAGFLALLLHRKGPR
ncbi:ABC transporter permease [Enemella evansiae]|uniref:ABC transporter permease n=1 Tax=Enemella evansiae TaxID=2016499 RepID=UPI001E551632|nr:iron chelate uptake ABC transporter family permease subunit [Enemella evansiae]